MLATTSGVSREDGKSNWHRPYWLLAEQPDGRFFKEVSGPFNAEVEVEFVVVADFDGNLDDLIFWERPEAARIYAQQENRT